MRSASLLVVTFAITSVCAAACGESSLIGTNEGPGGGDGGPCDSEGGFAFVACNGTVATTCSPSGGAPTVVDCATQGKICATGPGCVTCAPGVATCSGGHAKTCRSDGSGYLEFECDPVQGMTCDPNGCKGACATAAVAQSYIGCDYVPTVTPNAVWKGFSFAVAVANAGADPTEVTVTRGATVVSKVTIAPNALASIPLPWVTELKGGDVDCRQIPPDPGVTRVVAGGAYRLRATAPVTVYQLSPLDYQLTPAPADCPVPTQCGGTITDCLSYSNDASLLLPTPALTGDYTALAWASTKNRAGFITITAIQDNTVVALAAQGEIVAGGGVDATGAGSVTLAAGDVLEVLARHDNDSGYGADISGTRIHASHPVQVIAGHSCANIPAANTGYCDHLEEAMFPDESLGKDYIVGYPLAEVGDSPQEIRIAAPFAGTHVHFDPPIAPDQTLDPSAAPFTLLNVTSDVSVHADQPILVGQYMPGSTALPTPVGSGDPSLSLAVPTAQFRTSYIFVAPHNYYANFVNVTAPTGASVVLDGTAIPTSDFAAVGGSGFLVARHVLSQSDVHTITSSVPFGIVVYGYGKETSYMYPGGLDLKRVNPPPDPPK